MSVIPGRIIDKRRHIYGEPVSTAAKLLYLYLSARANAESVCWPGRDTIARDLSASISTVGRALAELARARLVVIESNGSDAGTNLYHLYSPDRRADTPPPVGHTDLSTWVTQTHQGAMKGHTDLPSRSHRPFNVGHTDPPRSTPVVQEAPEKKKQEKQEDAATVPSQNGSTPKKGRLSPVLAAALPSHRIAFDPAVGRFTGIELADRARWMTLTPDADLDYELAKAADHALTHYETDPIKNAAQFLSNWMKGAQRRIAQGWQPKGAARAPAAVDETPWFGPNLA